MPLTEALLVVLPFAAIELVLEGAADAAALAAPLPEAEAPPVDTECAFESTFAVAVPDCDAAACAAALAAVLALPLPMLAAAVEAPTAALTDWPLCAAVPFAVPVAMPMALPLPVLDTLELVLELTFALPMPTEAVFADVELP